MGEQITSEAQAEDILIAAVAGPEQALEQASVQDLDQAADVDETEAEEDGGGDEKVEAKAETKAEAKQAEPEEDYIEEPGEEGQEPTRHKVSELLADAKAFKAFKGREQEELSRIGREYATAATEEYKQVRQFSLQTGAMLQAAMHLLREPQPPQPPNPALMNQNYSEWEQKNAEYQHALYAYSNNRQQFDAAKALGAQLLQQAEDARARSEEERDFLALQQLERKGGWYADFAKDDPKNPNGVRAKFASEMKAAYGYSFEELDAVLTDPRNLEVAQDALAYRAMKAKSGDVKAKVEQKPKLVKTNKEAKGGSSAQARDPKSGQYVGNALAALKKTNSDDAAVAFFAGLSKAGRI